MRKIKVNVTKRDIDIWQNAKRANTSIQIKACEICAVARAVRRHKGLENASVTYSYIKLGSDEIAKLPATITELIHNLDDCKPVKPFSFTVEVA